MARKCTKLRGECHDARCYDDTPHACHSLSCLESRMQAEIDSLKSADNADANREMGLTEDEDWGDK